jgi:hypothetical protein
MYHSMMQNPPRCECHSCTQIRAGGLGQIYAMQGCQQAGFNGDLALRDQVAPDKRADDATRRYGSAVQRHGTEAELS